MPKKQPLKRTLSVGDLHPNNDDNILTEDSNADTSSINNTADGSSSSSYIVVNSKRRRKQKQLSNRPLSQCPSEHADRTQLYDDAINSVVNRSDCNAINNTSKNADHSVVVTDHQSSLCDDPDHLCVIQHLKETVTTLQNQLNFVLSFLGITNVNNVSGDRRYSAESLRTNNNAVNIVQLDQNDDTDHQTPQAIGADVISADVNNQIRPSDSYANAVHKPPVLSAPLREAVVSAMYHEFEEKDRRARSIVVAGVPPSSSDKSYIEKLCRRELHLVVEVVNCRRLGKPKPDHCQPVLATLRSVGEVEAVIKVAKDLRHSDDATVRSSVYINPNMTKAESLAAYQRRCRRREIAARRVTNHTRHTGGSLFSSDPVAVKQPPSAVPQLPVAHHSSTTIQHSIPVLSRRYLPTLHSSSTVEYQLPQPSVDSVQNVVTAVPVTVPPPATVTPPVAVGTMDPQPDTDITMVVTAPTGGGLADVHCSTNI